MSDETKIIGEDRSVASFDAGSVFKITLSAELPEYVFEVTSTERQPDGSLRIRAIRRERRPDDVPGATLQYAKDESEDSE